MRILVTGSRDWTDAQRIADVLATVKPGPVTLVSGACPTGADAMAERYAERRGWTVERHPAEWNKWGRRAGYVRNRQMVDLGADYCVAFIKASSRGATMTARMAEDAGIRTVRFEE